MQPREEEYQTDIVRNKEKAKFSKQRKVGKNAEHNAPTLPRRQHDDLPLSAPKKKSRYARSLSKKAEERGQEGVKEKRG